MVADVVAIAKQPIYGTVRGLDAEGEAENGEWFEGQTATRGENPR